MNRTQIYRIFWIFAFGCLLPLASQAEERLPHPYDYIKDYYSSMRDIRNGKSEYDLFTDHLQAIANALPQSEQATKQKIQQAIVCLQDMKTDLMDNKLVDLSGACVALKRYYDAHRQELAASPDSAIAQAFRDMGRAVDSEKHPMVLLGSLVGGITSGYIHYYARLDYGIQMPQRAKDAMIDSLELFETGDFGDVEGSEPDDDLIYIFKELKDRAFQRMDTMPADVRKVVVEELQQAVRSEETPWPPQDIQAAAQALAEAKTRYGIP